MPGQINDSVWPSNNDTRQPGDTRILDGELSRDVAIYVVVIVSNVLAIIINSFVIIITVSMATLRKCVSSYLVIQLCVFDILASCASMPKFIRLLAEGHADLIEDNTHCVVYEFLNGFFTYSICACILAINVDKYHSIKFPMHYSSHVTKTTVLITQGIVLFLSIAFSSTPLYATSGSHTRSCSYVYTHGMVNMPFAVVTVVLYFVVPTLCMTFMNISVYRVAKRSLAQISAAPTITYDAFYHNNGEPVKKANVCKDPQQQRTISVIAFGEKNGITNTAFCPGLSPDDKSTSNIGSIFGSQHGLQLTSVGNVQCGDGFSVDCGKLSGWKQCTPVTSPSSCDSQSREIQKSPLETTKMTPADVIKHVPKISKNNVIKTNRFVLKTNYKAVRSLVIPYIYFIAIWGSYFTVYLKYLHRDFSQTSAASFSAVGVLVYISYALNPVIFVLMRKNFKEESVEFFRSCRRKPSDLSVLELQMSQTFQQFLESSA